MSELASVFMLIGAVSGLLCTVAAIVIAHRVPDAWTPPASLTDEDIEWLNHHKMLWSL